MFKDKKKIYFANTKFTKRLGQELRSRRSCKLVKSSGNLNFNVLPRLVLPDQLTVLSPSAYPV